MQEHLPTKMSSTLTYCFRVWFLSSVMVVTFYLLGFISGAMNVYDMAGAVLWASISLPFIFLMNFLVQLIVKLTESNTYRKLIISALHVVAVITAVFIVEWLFTKNVNFNLQKIRPLLPIIIAGWISIWKIELHPNKLYDNNQDEIIL